jgi:hypothetical protein
VQAAVRAGCDFGRACRQKAGTTFHPAGKSPAGSLPCGETITRGNWRCCFCEKQNASPAWRSLRSDRARSAGLTSSTLPERDSSPATAGSE